MHFNHLGHIICFTQLGKMVLSFSLDLEFKPFSNDKSELKKIMTQNDECENLILEIIATNE